MSIKYGGLTKYKHAEIFTSLKYNPYRNRILSVGNSMIILLRKLSSPFCGDNLYDNDRSFSHFQLKLPRRNPEIIVSICSQDVVIYFVAFSYTHLAVVQWVLDSAVYMALDIRRPFWDPFLRTRCNHKLENKLQVRVFLELCKNTFCKYFSAKPWVFKFNLIKVKCFQISWAIN